MRSISIATLLLVTSPLEAQIVAPAGRTLFAEAVLVRSLIRYDGFERDADGTDLERWRSIWAVVWGARPHLSLSLVAPLVRTETHGPVASRSTSGSGDISLLARYDALRRNVQAGYTRLSPELGVELPTGGAFGGGSTNVIAGIVLSHVRDPDWWITDFQFTRRGEGDGGLDRGDRWRADVAYLRRVLPRETVGIPQVLLVAELNYEETKPSRREGSTVADSGGSLLFFSPGVEWIVSRRVVLELSVPLRIEADLDGNQPEPSQSVIAGLRWLF